MSMRVSGDRPDNILNLGGTGREVARGEQSPAQRSGQAIISMLQQAADVAKRNEERAKAQALQLAEELRASEERYRMLETRVRHFEARATEAENWLLRIHDEVQDRLIAPMTDALQADRSRR